MSTTCEARWTVAGRLVTCHYVPCHGAVPWSRYIPLHSRYVPHQVVSSHAVFAELARTRPDLALELLQTPTYWDRKGEIPEGAQPWFAVPAFAVAGSRLCAGLIDRSFVDAAQARFSAADGVPRLSPRLREALDEMERLAADERLVLSVTLRAGDVQLLHSHQTWHARSAFEDDASAPRHLL